MGLEIGQVIDGKYRIVRLLGEGGMGAVYEGENVRIHRRVAIKVLHANVAGNADSVQRFEREAQAAGRIGSDHIVEVLDLGELPGGDRYMVMEYLDGESLGRRIETRGRLDAREAGSLLLQFLDGLASAHGAGIIHRDLKPDNVFLLRSRKGQGDFVKILDFGISKFNALNADNAMSKTRTGAVMGTPYYMSPEQAKGAKEMDHRSDLYSSAVILYESITGKVPFDADTFNELLFKIALDTPVPPARHAPEIDPAFSAIVLKGMAREPKDRFQSAQEFTAAIEAWLASVHGLGAGALPPPRPPAPSALMLDATKAAPSPMLAQTPAPWSQTSASHDTEPAKALPRKKSYALPVAGLVGVVVVGAGVALGMRALSGSPNHVSVAPAASNASGAPQPSVEPRMAAPAASTAAPEPTASAPATTPVSPSTEPGTTAASADGVNAARKGVALTPPPKHVAAKRAAGATGAPGPATPPAPAAAAAPADGAGVTARKIRTEL
jgi:serine/threonine-protein kinase